LFFIQLGEGGGGWKHAPGSHCIYNTCIGGANETINPSHKSFFSFLLVGHPRRGPRRSELGAQLSNDTTPWGWYSYLVVGGKRYNCRYGYIYAQKKIDRLLCECKFFYFWRLCRSSAERSCGSGGSFFRERRWLFLTLYCMCLV